MVSSELIQLHDMETLDPVDASKLSKIDLAESILSLLFLTEKRGGVIKLRKFANETKQRSYIKRKFHITNHVPEIYYVNLVHRGAQRKRHGHHRHNKVILRYKNI